MLDCAHKTDSGGSTYGLNRFFVLLQGSEGVPVILEIKQELPNGIETSSGDLSKADAQKIFQSMQAIGGSSNPLLTVATLDGGAYLVREREREKGTIDLTSLDRDDWKDLAEQAGQAIARAHGHQPGAAKAINNWIGEDQDTLVDNLEHFACLLRRADSPGHPGPRHVALAHLFSKMRFQIAPPLVGETFSGVAMGPLLAFLRIRQRPKPCLPDFLGLRRQFFGRAG